MSKDSGIVNIHGRDYQTVAYRVGKFREKHPAHTLKTEVLERTEECVVMKATIADDAGRIIATGHSEEYRKASQINRTSALENAETSAIGRALAAFGIGGTEFATADEVANAIGQQKASVKPVTVDEWDKLDADTQKRLQFVVDCVRAAYDKDGPEGGAAVWKEQDLEAHERVAAWSRFTAQERSSMKKAHEKKAA
jgi:hypothetical protein